MVDRAYLQTRLAHERSWSAGICAGWPGATTGNFYVRSSADTVDRLFVGGASGNVGIGTTGPATRLQVIGDVRVGTGGTNVCVQRADGTGIAGACSSGARLKRTSTPSVPCSTA